MIVGPVNSARVHYSWEKSTFTAIKKKKRREREKCDAET